MFGTLDVHPGLCFPIGGTIGQGRPLRVVLYQPRGGECSQHVATSLNLLIQSILVSEVLHPPAYSRILSGVLSLNSC